MRPLYLAILFSSSLGAAPSVAAIRENLIKWEGYRLTPYHDPSNRAVWCVGVGHSLTAHRERVKPRYTTHEIERFLLRDIATSLDTCRVAVERFDDLPDDVQLVCINVAFSCGRAGFMRFVNLRRALRYRAYELAASELGHSLWYQKQVAPARARWAYGVLKAQP